MSYAGRIEELKRRAQRERAAFSPPAEPPDREAAMEFLREGAGPAVAVYLEAHTGGPHRFPPHQLEALREAMNDFLALYVRAHGVDYDPEFAVREAAELLVETENIHDVAVMLTGVPASARPGEREAAGK